MEIVKQKKQRKPKSPIDYANGKIYMIEPTCDYEEGDVYYGSCATELCKRFSQHRSKSNNCKSKILIDKYGRENVKILLIKLFPCASKNELEAEEGNYHRANKCVNKKLAGGLTAEEYKEHKSKYNKQYNHTQENKEKKTIYNKQYRANNIEAERARVRQYDNEHKQQRSEYQKQRRAKKREIAEHQKRLNELEQEAEHLHEQQRIIEILNEDDDESE